MQIHRTSIPARPGQYRMGHEGDDCLAGAVTSFNIRQVVLCGLVMACQSGTDRGRAGVKITLLIGDKNILIHDMSPVSTLDLITLYTQQPDEICDASKIVVGMELRVVLDIDSDTVCSEQLCWRVVAF